MIPTVFSQQMILRYSVGWGEVCPALFKETKETNCRALMTMNCWKRSAMCGYEIDSEYSFFRTKILFKIVFIGIIVFFFSL